MRRRATPEEAHEAIRSVECARDGGLGIVRYATPADRDWKLQLVLRTARRMAVLVTCRSRGLRGAAKPSGRGSGVLTVRLFDATQTNGYAPGPGRREEVDHAPQRAAAGRVGQP